MRMFTVWHFNLQDSFKSRIWKFLKNIKLWTGRYTLVFMLSDFLFVCIHFNTLLMPI